MNVGIQTPKRDSNLHGMTCQISAFETVYARLQTVSDSASTKPKCVPFESLWNRDHSKHKYNNHPMFESDKWALWHKRHWRVCNSQERPYYCFNLIIRQSLRASRPEDSMILPWKQSEALPLTGTSMRWWKMALSNMVIWHDLKVIQKAYCMPREHIQNSMPKP